MKSLTSFKQDIALKGTINVAPDKSISHRSLIFAAIANGQSKISNLLEGEDVLKTAQALRQMGVTINRQDNGTYIVNGVGIRGLAKSEEILDMGNSGTAARLMAGLVAPYNFTSTFDGDDSLRKRPMSRIFTPLQEFGVKISAENGNLMPFSVTGCDELVPISYRMNVASAQVKSCILLASLGVRGKTQIIEPTKCRDHTEIMMRYLGLNIESENFENGSIITYEGMQEFDAKDFEVPGDISSAAFFIVAALIVKDSHLIIKNIGLNPLRDGIIKSLIEMGGNITIQNERMVGGEKVADLEVCYSQLKGVEIPASRAASMIDEYPILAIAAANASGTTKMNGLEELKVKESNRLLMIYEGLKSCNIDAKMGEDYLLVNGGVNDQDKIAQIKTAMDHRIAMSFLIMGLTMKNGVQIDDSSMIKTSFPNFEQIIADFGVMFK